MILTQEQELTVMHHAVGKLCDEFSIGMSIEFRFWEHDKGHSVRIFNDAVHVATVKSPLRAIEFVITMEIKTFIGQPMKPASTLLNDAVAALYPEHTGKDHKWDHLRPKN